MDKTLIINSKDKRAMMLAELEKWNSAEQIVFLVDSMKFLSFSLVKFIAAICNDLIEKQTYIKTSRLNNSSLNSNSDFNNNNNDSNNNQQYSNILEEQANDILYFRVMSEKPIETKLKIMLSYLPLLKAQTRDFNLNESLRKSYQDQFQEVFKHCLRNKIHLVECYELSILASLHPIFDESQQMNFKAWIHYFECSLQNDQKSWQNQKLANKQVPSIIFSGYCNNDHLLKDNNHIDSSYYSLQNNDQHNGTSDNLNDYKLPNFENESINNDFNIDSASASLNLSLHMQTTQTAGNNNNNNLETNKNDSNAESTNQAKRLLTRQHMPLKLSTSLPPQNSNANNNYPRGFSSLNPYEDINSSASSMNSFTMNLKSDSSNNKQNDQNYSLNSYSDFDYLNLDNIMIPPLSSSSSSVQSVISSQFAGSNFTNKSTNAKISDSRKEISDNGIKNVTLWLKHLRLHKYTEYFSSMSYDEILSLNDEKLIESKITLGARKKILTNIEKLKNRPERIKHLINVIKDEKCPLNVSTLENILNELTEISITPMKQQNSPPTSLALLNSKAVSSNDSESNDLAQLFIDLLDKIQRFLIKQKSENCTEECDIVKLKELTLSYVKIIDKLFLTKAFSDVQNSQMAKLRNSVFDKNQTSKTENTFSSSLYRNHNKNFPISENFRRSNNNHLINFIEKSTDKNIFKPYLMENVSNSSANFQSSLDSNVNSQNALQRIKTRSVRYLSKTSSLPFSDNTLASSRNQSFLNYSNQNKNNN